MIAKREIYHKGRCRSRRSFLNYLISQIPDHVRHTHKHKVDLIMNLANYPTKTQYNATSFYLGKQTSYMAIHISKSRLLYILLPSMFFILDQSAEIKIGHHRDILNQVSCCLFFSVFVVFFCLFAFFFSFLKFSWIIVWPIKQDAISPYNRDFMSQSRRKKCRKFRERRS